MYVHMRDMSQLMLIRNISVRKKKYIKKKKMYENARKCIKIFDFLKIVSNDSRCVKCFYAFLCIFMYSVNQVNNGTPRTLPLVSFKILIFLYINWIMMPVGKR